MNRVIAVVVCMGMSFLTGCEDKQIFADLSFALTNQGYLNNSFYEAGHIFYVNIDNGSAGRNAGSGVGTCSYVGQVDVTNADFGTGTKGTLSASQIQGITVSASWIPAAQVPNVALDIGRRSTVKLTKYESRVLRNPDAVFLRAISKPLSPLRMQAVADSPSAAFALVTLDFSAESADYYIGAIDADKGEGITVTVGDVNVKATVTNNSTQNWKNGKPILRVQFFRVKRTSPASETYVPAYVGDALRNQIRAKMSQLLRACI